MEDKRFNSARGDGTGPIHPSVIFGAGCKVGFHVVIDRDCIIGDRVFIGNSCMIRSGVKIGAGSVIGHLSVIESDTVIGERVTIQSQCHITKNAKIGDDVFFGPATTCINTRRISHGRGYQAKLEGPDIRRAVRIGAAAVIMPGCVIGENAVLGAGSVLTSSKTIPPREVWFGTPATRRGMVAESEVL